VRPADLVRGLPRDHLGLVVTLLLVFALPAPAALAHGGHDHRTRAADRLLQRGVVTWRAPALTTVRRGGRRVRVEEHLDRRVGRLPRRPLGARASTVGADMAAGWCGEETETDRPNTLNSAPQIKVVYAHPSDVPSRLATYGGLIQAASRTAAEVVEARAGGSRTVRFDMGSSCGNQYLDIASVTLPETKAWYQEHQQVDTAAIRAQLGLPVGEVNMVVWADEIGTGDQPLGVGQTYLDDRPGDVNVNNDGGRDALIIGRGKAYFFDDAPASSWEPASVALHEVTHTLGAVQNGAPHSSKAGHCTDEWDIMCYADGSPTNPVNGSALTLSCPGSPSAEVYDCGGDDYFNVSPTPGSWLAGHWNVAFSPFLCPASSCFATLHPPTVTPTPTSASPDLYEAVRIDASDVTDDGPAPRIEWDVPDASDASTSADGHVLTATWDHAGVENVGVYVTDSDGNLARAIVPVTVTNRPPAARITAPGSAAAGSEVLLTAGDADHRPVARYRWDLDGVPGFELDTGANAWATTTFAAAGARTVGVQLTDSGGAVAEARATIAVSAAVDPPGGAVPAPKPSLDLRLGSSHVTRTGLRRGPVLLLVRSSAAGRVALRVGTRRDGARPLLRRTVVLHAGRWVTVRLRLPRRARALRSARVLRIAGTTSTGASRVLTVPVR
jgi:hypothetical protein